MAITQLPSGDTASEWQEPEAGLKQGSRIKQNKASKSDKGSHLDKEVKVRPKLGTYLILPAFYPSNPNAGDYWAPQELRAHSYCFQLSRGAWKMDGFTAAHREPAVREQLCWPHKPWTSQCTATATQNNSSASPVSCHLPATECYQAVLGPPTTVLHIGILNIFFLFPKRPLSSYYPT